MTVITGDDRQMAQDRIAIQKILRAMREYLPPGGKKSTFISAVIEAVDNPDFNDSHR